MSTVLVIVATGLLMYGAYQVPQVREATAPYVEQAQPYLDQAGAFLGNVKTEPTGAVLDRPEFAPKD